MVMDSEGLWWVDSWIEGGSLIEGPQVIKREVHAWHKNTARPPVSLCRGLSAQGVYYLFFASGRYCEEDYAEGVGRSASLFGPYEKAPAPLSGPPGGVKRH